MNDSNSSSEQPSKLWRKPKSKWLLGIPLGGFLMILVGAAGLGVTNTVLHATSETAFCNSCHSHEMFIQPEHESSGHFSNALGIRAECSDCHLPHGFFKLAIYKVRVSADIIPEMMGKLDTREKYEAEREHMAEAVWEEFRENDSAFCKHCHTFEAMNFEEQSRSTARRHQRAAEDGEKTCIDCHTGLVHMLPGEWEAQQEQAEADAEADTDADPEDEAETGP